MKKTLRLLFFAYFIFIFNDSIQSQQFFPLKIGNKFIYHYSFYLQSGGGGGYSESYDYACKITKDTLISGKKYYYIYDFSIANDGWYRVDSITGSLYVYDTTNSCLFYYKQNLIDSLLMNLNGIENSCSGYNINSVTQVTRWGHQSTDKNFHKEAYPAYNRNRLFSSFFGILSYTYSGVNGTTWWSGTNTLKGCKIDNIVYGDTTVIGIKEKNSKLSGNYFLSQNYPNPFNPTTNIEFHVSDFRPLNGFNKFVTLKIFDINGREVETLINSNVSPGTYKVTFNAKNIPSGIYIYRLNAGDYILSKKMIFLK